MLADDFVINVPLTDGITKDLVDIKERIAKGRSLAKYYRTGAGRTPDQLRRDTGIIHLHLDGKNSNALLYLLQFDEDVLFLRVDNHTHVDAKPVGRGLNILSIRKAEQKMLMLWASVAPKG